MVASSTISAAIHVATIFLKRGLVITTVVPSHRLHAFAASDAAGGLDPVIHVVGLGNVSAGPICIGVPRLACAGAETRCGQLECTSQTTGLRQDGNLKSFTSVTFRGSRVSDDSFLVLFNI